MNRMTLIALLGFVSFAGTLCGGDSEMPDPVAIRAALEDGLYDLAARQSSVYLQKTPVSDPKHGDAVVLMARALHGQGRYKEMIATVGDDAANLRTSESGAAVYWQAVAFYELGDWVRTLASVEGFAARYRGSPYVPRARRLEAWTRLKSGEVPIAMDIFARIDREYGDTADGRQNQLEWGQALLGQGDLDRARNVLGKLVEGPAASGEVQEGKLWMAQVMLRSGQWEKAWNLLNVVAGDSVVRVDRRARALLALSEIDGGQTNYEAAARGAAQAAEIAPTELLRNRAEALQGRWLIRSGKLDEGAVRFRKAISAAPGDPVSGALQLELAGAYLDAGKYEQAAEEYLYYLESFAGGLGQIQALRGRGVSLWNLRRHAEAAAIFEKAAGLATDSRERSEFLLKEADALFANAQYKLAYDVYGKVVQETPVVEWVPQSLLQQGECLARQKEWERAEECWRGLAGRFPASPHAERALLRIAECREERGSSSMQDALAAYDEMIAVFPQGPLYPEALYRRGLVNYQLLQFGDAVQDFTKVVNEHTNSVFAPQALFMKWKSCYWRKQVAVPGRLFPPSPERLRQDRSSAAGAGFFLD